MDDSAVSEVIEIDAADVTHLPDDGVAPVGDGRAAARDVIDSHPFLAVGAAIAAGYLIGRAIRVV